MAKTPLQRAFAAGRLVLLAGALAAGATAAVWTFWPELVDRAGDYLVKRMTWRAAARIDAAEQIADPVRREAALRTEIAALRHLRQGDRLIPSLARASQLLANQLSGARRPLEAAAVVDRWLEVDPNNLHARVRHATLLCSVPERRVEGLQALRDLHGRLPEVAFIAAALSRELRRDGDYDGAFAALQQVEATAPLDWWRVFHLDGRFNIKLLANLDDDGNVTMSFESEPGLIGFEIEPPPLVPMEIADLHLAIHHGDKVVSGNLVEAGIELRGATLHGKRIRTDEVGVARIVVPLPGLPQQRFGFTISARVRQLPSSGMVEMANDEAAMRHAAGKADPEMVRTLRRAWSLTLERGELEVYWRAEGQQYAAERHVSAALHGDLGDAALSFDMELPATGPAVAVRVDLPGSGPRAPARTFEIHGVTVIDAAGVQELMLDGSPLEARHDVEIDGHRLTVTGDDPYFALALKRPVAELRAVRVNGVVR